jgi:SMODS-associating 2TM, beta-strand rich effector domain
MIHLECEKLKIMDKVKKRKLLIDGVILSALTAFFKSIADKKAIIHLLGIQENELANYSICLFLLIVVFWLIEFIFTKLYDRYLWKIMFPRLNLNGKWTYKNSYDDSSPSTEGTIEIKQTPNDLKIEDGNSANSNQHNATTEFKSISFITDKILYGCYEVTMTQKGSGAVVVKKSVEELTIINFGDSGKNKNKPAQMTSKFFNCVATNDEKQKAASSGLNNIEKTGTAVYTRIKQ